MLRCVQFPVPLCSFVYSLIYLPVSWSHSLYSILLLSRPSLTVPITLSFSLSFPPFSLSLPGSLPSVCLCAGGAGCYLDDLVREGERDFISCLPEGLWYPRCFKAALLKKKKKSCIQLWRSAGELRVKGHSCIWILVWVLRMDMHLWACDSSAAIWLFFFLSS